MKKIISIITGIALVFSFATPAFAKTTTHKKIVKKTIVAKKIVAPISAINKQQLIISLKTPASTDPLPIIEISAPADINPVINSPVLSVVQTIEEPAPSSVLETSVPTSVVAPDAPPLTPPKPKDASIIYSVVQNSNGTYTITAVNEYMPNANGAPFLSQPFDPATGEPFKSAEEANQWAQQTLSNSFTCVRSNA